MPTATYDTAGDDTWTAPSDVVSPVIVQVWGGGAGGATPLANGAGGGGGGGYSIKDVIVVGSTVYNLHNGAGGSGGVNGEDTWFKTTGDVLAKGGVAGAGRVGGAGGASASGVGDTKYSGGTGGTTGAGELGGSGGGASAGTGSNGNNGGNGGLTLGGPGGTATTGGAAGGAGGDNTLAGSNGNVPGGGGGGAGGGGTPSGTGAHGRVVITYDLATDTLIPDGTESDGDWLPTGDVTLHEVTDEGVDTADDDTTYMDQVAPFANCVLTFTDPTGSGPFSQITLRIRAAGEFNGGGCGVGFTPIINGGSLSAFHIVAGDLITAYSLYENTWEGYWTAADLATIKLSCVYLNGIEQDIRVSALEFLLTEAPSDPTGSIGKPWIARSPIQDVRPYFE